MQQRVRACGDGNRDNWSGPHANDVASGFARWRRLFRSSVTDPPFFVRDFETLVHKQRVSQRFPHSAISTTVVVVDTLRYPIRAPRIMGWCPFSQHFL